MAKKPATKKAPAKKAPAKKAPAKKTAAKKAPAKKAPAKKTTQTRFPKRELNAWLKKNTSWNHDQWLALLEDLTAKGFTKYTGSQEGQDEIGLYLESNRSK